MREESTLGIEYQEFDTELPKAPFSPKPYEFIAIALHFRIKQ